MSNFLLKPRSLLFLSFLTFGLILIFLLGILPHNFNWQGYQNVSGDTAQHLSGWYAFVHEPWRFPLLKILLLNYPTGATVSLTDSIPLFSLPFKLLRGLLPAGFNFFAIFLLFIYVCQGFAALTLAYAVKKNNLLVVLTFVILTLTAPIVSFRAGGEDSLACQGIIVLAISGYFFAYFKELHGRSCQVFFGILIMVSLLVHPYFTAMIYPFYLAALWKVKENDQLSWRNCLIPLICLHVLIGLEFVLLGLGKGAQNFDDFGIPSMNLLAPFYGGWLFHDQSIVAYGDQGEGFAYLGMGLILMILIALGLGWRDAKENLRRYRALVIIGLLYFILAIYGHIYFGQHKILVYGVPHFFFTYDFRANGRFFWPTWYLLMVFAVLSVVNSSLRPLLKSTLVLILLGLQLFDVSGYLKNVKELLRSDFTPAMVANPEINQIEQWISQSKLVVFYPKMGCPNMHVRDYQLLAVTQLETAKVGVPINTAYLAHYRSFTCGDEANDFSDLNPKLLVSSVTNPSPTIQKLLKTHPKACHTINQVYYCEYAS